MLDAAEHHGWVEAMKELKSQYYVGSQDAFRYLKAMRWYEKVREEILHANPTIAQKFDLSVKMVAWWMQTVQIVLEYVLDFEAIKVSTSSSVSLVNQHIVITPLDYQQAERERWCEGYKSWTLDFSACLIAFMTDQLPEEPDVMVLAKWIRKNFRNGRICPIFVESGQPVSFRQFRKNDKFRKTEDSPWDLAALTLASEIVAGRASLVPQLLLKQALAAGDIEDTHSLLQRLWIETWRRNFREAKFGLTINLKSSFCSADRWLYDECLYERAEREYTLGSMEIERRIALNAVQSSIFDGLIVSPTALVDNVLDNYRTRIRNSYRRMERFSDYSNDKKQPQDYFLTKESRILKRYQYIYRALHQNKKWLIEFLSH